MNKNKLLNIIVKEIQELETSAKSISDKIDSLKNLVELLQEEEETAEVKEVIKVKEVIAEKQPVVEPAPEIIVEKEPEKVVETLVTPVISVTPITPTSIEIPKRTILADTMKTTSLNEKLSEKANKSLDQALSSQKVTDLKKSISLNDKFRFQRELFGGNAALLNQTLEALNEIKDKNEATEFLAGLNLDSENPTAKEFLELINRKFV